MAQGQLSPPPGGGYPNDNTAGGMMRSLASTPHKAPITRPSVLKRSIATRRHYNTANGAQALYSNTGGDNNTATGSCAL